MISKGRDAPKSSTLGKCRIIKNSFTENVNNAMKMDKYANARQLLHISNYTGGLNVKHYISYIRPGQFKHQCMDLKTV